MFIESNFSLDLFSSSLTQQLFKQFLIRPTLLFFVLNFCFSRLRCSRCLFAKWKIRDSRDNNFTVLSHNGLNCCRWSNHCDSHGREHGDMSSGKLHVQCRRSRRDHHKPIRPRQKYIVADVHSPLNRHWN